jgi:hypothetical protein
MFKKYAVFVNIYFFAWNVEQHDGRTKYINMSAARLIKMINILSNEHFSLKLTG